MVICQTMRGGGLPILQVATITVWNVHYQTASVQVCWQYLYSCCFSIMLLRPPWCFCSATVSPKTPRPGQSVVFLWLLDSKPHWKKEEKFSQNTVWMSMPPQFNNIHIVSFNIINISMLFPYYRFKSIYNTSRFLQICYAQLFYNSAQKT